MIDEKENSCNLPSGDVLFDSSASTIPEYEYEAEKNDELEHKIFRSY